MPTTTLSVQSEHLKILKAQISEIITQSTRFQTSVNEPASNASSTRPTASAQHINPLHLSHTSSKLLHAHATKLSLLLINKPYTPTAVSKILSELSSSPLPALETSVTLCEPAHWTKCLHNELAYRVSKVFSTLVDLVVFIPFIESEIQGLEKLREREAEERKERILKATGVLWTACEQVMELSSLGVGGLVVQKAEQWRAMLKDAVEELQEWGEEEAEEVDEDDDENDDQAHEADVEEHVNGGNSSSTNDTQAAIDSLLSSSTMNHLPSPENDVSQIRPRLESSLRRLKLIILLYTALIKRRFKSLPDLPFSLSQSLDLSIPKAESSDHSPPLNRKKAEKETVPAQLDSILTLLRRIPHIADELASAFYELDSEEIDKRMDECFFAGWAAGEVCVMPWSSSQVNGEEKKDAFSEWVTKFQGAMKVRGRREEVVEG